MKILVIEGIATSGKSSLTKSLAKALKDKKVVIFAESRTHIPIMKESASLNIDFFKAQLEDSFKTKADLIIFDRLHLTQAFRAKANIEDLTVIENMLLNQEVLLAYLKVDESTITSRVELAASHRDKDWGEYIQTKGSTFEDIAKYYIEQQHNQLKLVKRSKLPSKIFDTTDHDYESIANQIIYRLFHQA